MNRTTSVSLQIAFFIFMIIGLSLFFGAYALIVPAVLGYIWAAITFGRQRIRQTRLSLEQARRQGMNRFGLPDLPRFYGFLTVLWWILPPILLLILYRTVGTPILTGMIEREVLVLMGKSIDPSQLHAFAQSTLAGLGIQGQGSTAGFSDLNWPRFRVLLSISPSSMGSVGCSGLPCSWQRWRFGPWVPGPTTVAEAVLWFLRWR